MITSNRDIALAAEQVAAGHLTAEVKSRGERDMLGMALARMMLGLRGMASQVSENAIALDLASGQLAFTGQQTAQAPGQNAGIIQEIARGISQQSESISYTAVTVEQMSRAMEGVARGAQDQSIAADECKRLKYHINSGPNTGGWSILNGPSFEFAKEVNAQFTP